METPLRVLTSLVRAGVPTERIQDNQYVLDLEARLFTVATIDDDIRELYKQERVAVLKILLDAAIKIEGIS
jgi:hypothetical protein